MAKEDRYIDPRNMEQSSPSETALESNSYLKVT